MGGAAGAVSRSVPLHPLRPARRALSRGVAVAVLASVSLLSGCADRTGGPLSPEGLAPVSARSCMHSMPWEDTTFGMDALENTGDRGATLEGLRLVDPVGLHLVEARLIEIARSEDDTGITFTLAGVQGGPPGSNPDLRERWERGVPAVGATIAPGEGSNLVLWLRRDASAHAGFERIEIAYRAAGRSHRWRSIVRYDLVADCDTLRSG
jgi:hypothetical protein